MSKENAKLLYERIRNDDELKKRFRDDMEAAFSEEERGCTRDEFALVLREAREARDLNRELDDAELESVSGGAYCVTSGGTGNCIEDVYLEKCAATVEPNGWCGSNDWCIKWSDTYHCIAEYDANKHGPGFCWWDNEITMFD